jgi:uncharacterized repeat protein (TIGR03837 family)
VNRSIDLYCRVVDNFGDAGIAWRLARQLVAEHGCQVRLIIDQPGYVFKLEAATETLSTPFCLQGIAVFDWQRPPALDCLPQVVIAAFQCQLPSALEALLAQPPSPAQPLWINLDYLSAETWVDEAHGRPSHKSFGGTEWFYLPGFTAASGGLIREHDATPDHGSSGPAEQLARAALPQVRGVPVGRTGGFKISLFCYSGQDLSALIERWSTTPSSVIEAPPIDVMITAGCDVADIRRQLQIPSESVSFRRGRVDLHFLPWLKQRDYDFVLADCDLNFVRGEDSWIRAIWAAKPFVWRPYPQSDGADRIKLDAFLRRCEPDFSAQCYLLVSQMMHAWRANRGCGELWSAWHEQHAEMAGAFSRLRQRLALQPGLAARLTEFIENRLV